MAKNHSETEYENKLNEVLKKLEDNAMDVIEVCVNGEIKYNRSISEENLNNTNVINVKNVAL